jgi:ribosome-associated protein
MTTKHGGDAIVTINTVGANSTKELTPLELTTQIINACADAKGKDIAVLDVSKVFGLADYFIVVSGRSDRQVQGISNKVVDSLSRLGVHPAAREGLDEGQWVLLDYGDVIVHVFYEPARDHYDVESLWTKARRLEVIEGDWLQLRAA